MPKSYHPDILDNGLKVISDNANLSMVVTAGAPATREEATTLHPTGKRVSNVIAVALNEAVLGDGTAGARKVTIASKNGTVAASVVGADLHIAIYDGSRLLVVNDESSNQPLSLNNPITIPSFDIAINQPV
jgi:hypothetical protein